MCSVRPRFMSVLFITQNVYDRINKINHTYSTSMLTNLQDERKVYKLYIFTVSHLINLHIIFYFIYPIGK